MEIRHLYHEELPELQAFIHKFWKPNHVLATSKELMDFQHKEKDHYNWIIYKDEDGIQAILGFVSPKHYDPEIDQYDLWGCIWKKSDKKLPGIGSKLWDYLEEYYNPTSMGAIGINDTVETLYRKMGWRIGVLDHYVFVNPGRIPIYTETEVFVPGGFCTQELPKKTADYYMNRFANHPFYDYQIWMKSNLSIVTRKITTENGVCLRIVDAYGDYWNCSRYALHELCLREGVDYIDLVTNRGPLNGMTKTEEFPNWFEPFDPEPHPIKYAFKSSISMKVSGGDVWNTYAIFRGDADQDRPNIL